MKNVLFGQRYKIHLTNQPRQDSIPQGVFLVCRNMPSITFFVQFEAPSINEYLLTDVSEERYPLMVRRKLE